MISNDLDTTPIDSTVILTKNNQEKVKYVDINWIEANVYGINILDLTVRLQLRPQEKRDVAYNETRKAHKY